MGGTSSSHKRKAQLSCNQLAKSELMIGSTKGVKQQEEDNMSYESCWKGQPFAQGKHSTTDDDCSLYSTIDGLSTPLPLPHKYVKLKRPQSSEHRYEGAWIPEVVTDQSTHTFYNQSTHGYDSSSLQHDEGEIDRDFIKHNLNNQEKSLETREEGQVHSQTVADNSHCPSVHYTYTQMWENPSCTPTANLCPQMNHIEEADQVTTSTLTQVAPPQSTFEDYAHPSNVSSTGSEEFTDCGDQIDIGFGSMPQEVGCDPGNSQKTNPRARNRYVQHLSQCPPASQPSKPAIADKPSELRKKRKVHDETTPHSKEVIQVVKDVKPSNSNEEESRPGCTSAISDLPTTKKENRTNSYKSHLPLTPQQINSINKLGEMDSLPDVDRERELAIVPYDNACRLFHSYLRQHQTREMDCQSLSLLVDAAGKLAKMTFAEECLFGKNNALAHCFKEKLEGHIASGKNFLLAQSGSLKNSRRKGFC